MFKLYKSHNSGKGYTYRELYSLVIREWGLKEFPFLEAHRIIKNYLLKEGVVERRLDEKGHVRYIPTKTKIVSKPINLGTDVSTGFNIYALPEEKKFAVIDEEWNVKPEPKKRYIKITVTTTFSLDTGGGHQRLKFYEATAFVTIPYTTDVVSIGEELKDFIREAISYYFNPGVAEASEIKIGVELMSNPPEESGDPVVIIEYGHEDTKFRGYSTLKKKKSLMEKEKKEMFNPHKGFGRPKKEKQEKLK